MNARDKAGDELARALRKERSEVAAVVDLMVLAAAQEACSRVNESLVDNLRASTAKLYDGLDGLLFRASRELGGEHG